jgi:hypothetical protein
VSTGIGFRSGALGGPMNVSPSPVSVAAGILLMLAVATISSDAGRSVLLSTYAFAAAVLLATIGIALNAQRTASPDLPMSRLLHDPDARHPGGSRRAR